MPNVASNSRLLQSATVNAAPLRCNVAQSVQCHTDSEACVVPGGAYATLCNAVEAKHALLLRRSTQLYRALSVVHAVRLDCNARRRLGIEPQLVPTNHHGLWAGPGFSDEHADGHLLEHSLTCTPLFA